MNSKLLVILTLVAVIGFATVTPVSAVGCPQVSVTTSPPCECSTSAVYTFYVDTSLFGVDLLAMQTTIPAGYTINSAYLTTTPGIVVATGDSGDVFPMSSGNPIVIKTTTTSGTFDVFRNGNPSGTLTIVLPTATTSGELQWVFSGSGMPTNTWSETSFVAGFFTNPCIPGTYIWGPNTVFYEVEQTRFSKTCAEGDLAVTLTDCAVGGVVVPTNTLAILSPYLALAGLIAAVSAVVVVKRRRD